MTEGEEGTSRCPLAPTEPFVSIPLFPVLFGTDTECWNRRQVPHTTSLRPTGVPTSYRVLQPLANHASISEWFECASIPAIFIQGRHRLT